MYIYLFIYVLQRFYKLFFIIRAIVVLLLCLKKKLSLIPKFDISPYNCSSNTSIFIKSSILIKDCLIVKN